MTWWKGKRRVINLCPFWMGVFEGRLERRQLTSLHKWKHWAFNVSLGAFVLNKPYLEEHLPNLQALIPSLTTSNITVYTLCTFPLPEHTDCEGATHSSWGLFVRPCHFVCGLQEHTGSLLGHDVFFCWPIHQAAWSRHPLISLITWLKIS